jgi:hypothetical protein
MIRKTTNAREASRLRERGYRRPPVEWTGTLVEVVVRRRGKDTVVRVAPRALGVVDGFGLVTAGSKDALDQAVVDAAPASARWEPLLRLHYDRWRPRYGERHWFHQTPGAEVALVRPPGGDRPVAYLRAPSEEICSHLPGEFLCTMRSMSPSKSTRAT